GLADFERDELPDDAGAEDDGQQEGKQSGEGGAEGRVLEEVQEREGVGPAGDAGVFFSLEGLIPEIVNGGQHQLRGKAAFITRSTVAVRLPLKRTASPGFTSLASHAAASSRSGK